jgi:hypothetical protein
MVPIGFYRPDAPPTMRGVSGAVLNAILTKDIETGVAYGPQRGIGILDTADALPAAPRGAASAVTRSGAYRAFVGTATKLYEVSADGSVTEIGTGYALPPSDTWSMAQVDDYMYFTNITDGILRYNVETGGAVTVVSGAPKARFIFPLFNTLAALDCDGDNRMLRTSKIGDGSVWSGDASCRFQPFEEGEALIAGGEINQYGAIVMQNNAIRLLSRTRDHSVFTSALVESSSGAQGPDGVCFTKGWCYFMDTDGPQRTNGAVVEPIGLDKVANTMVASMATNGTQTVQTVFDPAKRRVLYRYMTAQDTSEGVFSSILAYYIDIGEWAPLEIETATLVSLASPGYTLEELDVFGDLEHLPYPLDSRVWKGGEPRVGAFNAAFKFGFLEGDNLECTLETGQIVPKTSTRVTRVTPFTNSTEMTVQVGFKKRIADALAWGDAASVDENGQAPVDEAGNVIAFRAVIPAGTDWAFMRGFDYLKSTTRGLAYA